MSEQSRESLGNPEQPTSETQNDMWSDSEMEVLDRAAKELQITSEVLAELIGQLMTDPDLSSRIKAMSKLRESLSARDVQITADAVAPLAELISVVARKLQLTEKVYKKEAPAATVEPSTDTEALRSQLERQTRYISNLEQYINNVDAENAKLKAQLLGMGMEKEARRRADQRGFYDTLGLDLVEISQLSEAEADDLIAKRGKELLLQLHPDNKPDHLKAVFTTMARDVQEATQALKTKALRERYQARGR